MQRFLSKSHLLKPKQTSLNDLNMVHKKFYKGYVEPQKNHVLLSPVENQHYTIYDVKCEKCQTENHIIIKACKEPDCKSISTMVGIATSSNKVYKKEMLDLGNPNLAGQNRDQYRLRQKPRVIDFSFKPQFHPSLNTPESIEFFDEKLIKKND